MSTIVTRLFDTYEHASLAVTELESHGIAHGSISLVANNVDNRYNSIVSHAHGSETAAGAGTGATLGTVLGGGAGLLAGLGMLAIPGVGPVVAAGWLVATAVGAGLGAASGGILGSLVGAGVSETDAHVYAEGVRRGGTLVTVKVDESQTTAVEHILDKHNAVDTVGRADSYRAEGWSGFDEAAPAYRANAADISRGTPIL
jgi:hypothetical protein